MANYKGPSKSEPKNPPAGKRTYRGPQGGTFTKTRNGNKEYYGNNGK